jgi:hypothetical protein
MVFSLKQCIFQKSHEKFFEMENVFNAGKVKIKSCVNFRLVWGRFTKNKAVLNLVFENSIGVFLYLSKRKFYYDSLIPHKPQVMADESEL